MLALVLEDELCLAPDYPQPVPGPGEALIQVRLAGICATDLEVVRGYRQYRGVLGHEFVGEVTACSEPDTAGEEGGWIGRRVVGEINIVCGDCWFCRRGLPTHCTSRAAIGISGHEGAFAEFLTLPLENLHPVPPELPDDAAVFAEPLAAALQTLSLVHIRPGDRVGVVGDGKLGLLSAQVLATTGAEVTVIGRHPEKLALAAGWGFDTGRPDGPLDIVVECSGNPSGLTTALELVRPRGTIVLKSTYHGLPEVDLSRVVVDEIRLVGSRCGPFRPALGLLQSGRVEVTSLIEARYPLVDGLAALQHAGRRGALKVLIRP
jgi:threonine dehydrogenase-like Zn-dependent dehydrogenase